MSRFWQLIILFVLLFSSTSWAEARPKIGVVLGGGGAAGVAHVGVLKVLEENNIPIDMIAGTSMGAIIAGLYASGKRADELEAVVNSLDWLALFSDSQARTDQNFHQKQANTGFFRSFELGIRDGRLKAPSGVVTGQKLMFELRRLFASVGHVHDFDQLPIPFRAVATDLETGEAVVLKQGNLAQSVRASMAIPGVFSPVKIGNQLLVDGFVSNNVPVDVVQAMGADILIVVSIPTFLEKQEKLDSAVNISLQAMQLMMMKTTQPQLAKMGPQDILIEPGIKDIGNLAFNRVGETIPLGVKATRQQLAALRKLAIPEARLARGKAKTVPQAMRIDRIELKNDSVLQDSILLGQLDVRVGDIYDPVALQRDLESIHGLGYFDLVDHTLVQQGNETVLRVNAQKRSTGDQRLSFGFSLADDLDGDSRYQFGVRHKRSGINDRGAEWSNSALFGDTIRFESKLYQPVSEHLVFIEAGLWYDDRDFYFYQGGERLAEVRSSELGFRGDIGKEFENRGEVRLGAFYRRAKPDIKTGQVDLPKSFTRAGGRLQLNYDSMDDDLLPNQGSRLKLDYTHGSKLWGSDENFDRLHITADRAWTKDKHRLMVTGEAGTTFDDDTLLTEQFTLGGLGRMSGLYSHQVRGNHVLSSAVIYMQEVANTQEIARFYVGGSVETGNAWEKKADVETGDLLASSSLFVGADTPLGLVFAGVAKTEGYEIQPFLYLGQGF